MSRAVRPRFYALIAALCAVSLAFVAASCGSEPGTPTAPSGVANSSSDLKGGSDKCGAGGIKVERAPYTATVPPGEILTDACVKAGSRTISLADFDDCYALSVDNDEVTVTKIGSGRNCQDISYVTFYTAVPTPTPTATPTDTPTPTPTSTPTNTPTTTATPTPTNTPTNTPVLPTPTPTNTPTNTPVPPTPTPTNTPTNTPVPPTPTPTPTPAPVFARAGQ